MPLAIPPADLQASTSASQARATHVKLTDSTIPEKLLGLDDDPESGVTDDKYVEERRRAGGVRGAAGRAMDFLVEHGVEERGIDPVPEDVSGLCSSADCWREADSRVQERIELKWWSMIPQFTLWAAANTNVLSVRQLGLRIVAKLTKLVLCRRSWTRTVRASIQAMCSLHLWLWRARQYPSRVLGHVRSSNGDEANDPSCESS